MLTIIQSSKGGTMSKGTRKKLQVGQRVRFVDTKAKLVICVYDTADRGSFGYHGYGFFCKGRLVRKLNFTAQTIFRVVNIRNPICICASYHEGAPRGPEECEQHGGFDPDLPIEIETLKGESLGIVVNDRGEFTRFIDSKWLEATD
jgi:hypothetical protein